ncbi:hypothetical protein DOTSEDRAFT_25657 [Dothistroma septosporum NZE10]|uniref:DUF7730 domain-containing protein n=1 Tax=Dothistroma septosporum (strain NZE10 / CBS 128990) TaxID=675120 RepID=N1PH92_DOTSN|nr:hypothetical protein DOTSEDRAFT_25657 [Dothistroma septosporum NZE10]
MVFEFTGKPPACGTPTTFASFTSTLTANTATRSPFTTASFGASFGTGSSLQQNSTTLTPFGTTTTSAQASKDTTPPSEDIPQGDDLMRALKRCATNRQAVFGVRDMNADAVLNEVLGLCDLDAERLMIALREASSEVGMFARAVFNILLQQHPGAWPGSSRPAKAEESVPRWLSGEKRKVSNIPKLLVKKAKQDEMKEKEEGGGQSKGSGINSGLPIDTAADSNTTSTSATPTKPFRFLDLPAEMRNIVYRELLVSKTGYIFLAGRPYTIGETGAQNLQPELRQGLDSDCDSAILGSCKQTYDEAKDILYCENKIIMSFKVEKSNRPFLANTRIGSSSLARITSLTLILDMCSAGSNGAWTHRFFNEQDFEKLVCWRELQLMTALKHLRLTVVERAEPDHPQAMLTQIMERIPATCRVKFGMETDFEKEYVRKVIADVDEPVHKKYYRLDDSYEADVDMLRTIAEDAMATKGSKSGQERDYRFADRSFTSKLGSLAGSEAIDPRYVLGGGS